jgi:hypothetical protein
MKRRRRISGRRRGIRLPVTAVFALVALTALAGAVAASPEAEAPSALIPGVPAAPGIQAAEPAGVPVTSGVPDPFGAPAADDGSGSPRSGPTICGDLLVSAVSAVVERPNDIRFAAGLSIYVVARNVGSQPTTVTPLDLCLRDDRGRQYALIGSRGVSPAAFPAAVLEPGESAQGWRTFEMPADASGLRLVVSNDEGTQRELRLPTPDRPDPSMGAGSGPGTVLEADRQEGEE